MKTKKIIEVLEFVKGYCAETKRCHDNNCPFYDSSCCECYLLKEYMLYPEQWNIEMIKSNLKDIEKL